jgi:MFS family permease
MLQVQSVQTLDFFMNSPMTLAETFNQLRPRLRAFITGGDWALALPEAGRRNLYSFWFDGLFAAASDTIPLNYLTLYLLSLGATGTQIGWFSSLTSLAAAVCLLPGALLVERYGRRKDIVVWFGGGAARVFLLALALLPLGLAGQPLIWGLTLIAVIRSAAGNLAFPAWMSITGDIVPIESRGRYFGSRNLVMGVAAMLMTYLVGEIITRIGAPAGYQAMLILAFAIGMISTYCFASLKDLQGSQPVQSTVPVSLGAIWQDLRASPVFLFFCFAAALWNFSINIAGPFYNVYMAQNLNFTAAMIGVTAVATSLTKMLSQPKMGELSDRWGPGRVQLISMFLMPLLPLTWIFITQLWQVVALNIVGGVFWGAFELASFNFILLLTPAEQRARYSAIYQLVVALALTGGAALGASMVTIWGYKGIFVATTAGRIVSAFVFMFLLRFIRRPEKA